MKRKVIMFLMCAVLLAGCKKGEAEEGAETEAETTTIQESDTGKPEKKYTIRINGIDYGDEDETLESEEESEGHVTPSLSDEEMKAIEESIEQRILESLGITESETESDESSSPQVVMWTIGETKVKFPITEAEFRARHPYARDDGTMFSMYLDDEYVVVYRMMEGMNSWLRVSTVTAEDSAKQERKDVAVLPCGHYLGEKVTMESIFDEGFVKIEEEKRWFIQQGTDAYYLPTELDDQGLVQGICIYTNEAGDSYISTIGFSFKE